MKAQQLFEAAVNAQLTGDFEAAKTNYKKLLRTYPDNSVVLGNLAVIVKKEGQLAVAENMLQRAVRANPQNFSALTTLANIALDRKDFDKARALNDTALSIEPHSPDALVNRGVLLIRDNQITKAEDDFWRAMQLDPNNINAKMNLANCRRLRKENVEGSITMLLSALEQQPDNPGIHILLCYSYQDTLQFVKALQFARSAYAIKQEAEYALAIANALVVLGEFEEGLEYYQHALKACPEAYMIEGSYLFALNYDHRKTPEQVFAEYQRYGQKLALGKTRFSHEDRPKIEGRKIRIGYSSPDLYSHVVTYFLEPILRNHDKERFEVFAYANVAKPDTHTMHLKRYFDHWVDVVEMNDEDMARRIKDDEIDILIDLAGHTFGNRLRALASRPAPIQATYLGYGYTTGMEEIDYFIGDPNFTPEGCDAVFSEKVQRIQAPVYAYNPPRVQIPDVEPLPALEKGYVTFGTMTRLVRLNDGMLKVWKRVLDSVPGSKLRIDQKPFEEKETIARFHERLNKLGFGPGQVELVSTHPHWDGYHQFDISLDCWPHNTGTTIFDSLFSGVPVISKRDRPSVGRLSAMVLEPIGLGDWIADTEDEFVEKAVAMASDLPELAQIRAGLRARVEASPFFDFTGRTRSLEAGYLDMVRRYNEART
jgi:protein O-GlcNAc transferase